MQKNNYWWWEKKQSTAQKHGAIQCFFLFLLGIHRYVFLVFRQYSLIDPESAGLPRDDMNDPERTTFHLRTFIRDNQLDPRPVAGNYFRAMEDAYSAAQWQSIV